MAHTVFGAARLSGHGTLVAAGVVTKPVRWHGDIAIHVGQAEGDGWLVQRWNRDRTELLGMSTCQDRDDAALAAAFEILEEL
jgi:hypothetical protein